MEGHMLDTSRKDRVKNKFGLFWLKLFGFLWSCLGGTGLSWYWGEAAGFPVPESSWSWNLATWQNSSKVAGPLIGIVRECWENEYWGLKATAKNPIFLCIDTAGPSTLCGQGASKNQQRLRLRGPLHGCAVLGRPAALLINDTSELKP